MPRPTLAHMTNLITLAEALTPVREMYSELISAAVAWQAGRERRTDPDHFALICVGADRSRDDVVSPTRWSRTTVFHVLRCGIPSWCASSRCALPEALPEAMWEWFDFLDETGALHPASDPLGELRKPLLCYGWLDHRGRRLAADAPSPVACECLIPYRETVELLQELQRSAELRGTDPLDPLRRLAGRPRPDHTPWWERRDDGDDEDDGWWSDPEPAWR